MITSLYKRTGIYAIRNKITGKAYIGQTAMNFGDRRDCNFAKLRHNKHDNHNLQEDFNKYGENNYEFVGLEELSDCSSIDEREKFWISKYKEEKLSYNISEGGKGVLGVHLSDETKRKIGEKNRINMLGRKASPETKAKMSKTRLGRKHTEVAKEKIRRSKLGMKLSDEAKQKISISNSGEKSAFAKYSKEQILKARELYDNGCRDYKIIALETGIKYNSIYGIVKRTRWKYI